MKPVFADFFLYKKCNVLLHKRCSLQLACSSCRNWFTLRIKWGVFNLFVWLSFFDDIYWLFGGRSGLFRFVLARYSRFGSNGKLDGVR